MKYLIIILFCLGCFISNAQQRFPTGFPTQFNTGFNRWGYAMTDSGLIVANRDTNWLAKYSGTLVFKPSNKKFYYFDSTILTWNEFGTVIDTTSLSNRINLKLNISDTANMLLPYLRKADTTNKWVQDIYVRNDSLFKFKNGTETFVDTLNGGGGGGSGLTSVGLSMPSAFSVSGSPLTSNGTISVSGAGTTAQYIRGNGTLATTDTGMIPNFYLKVRSLITNTLPITYNSATGAIGINDANVTGTKGAATFVNSSFSDNGLGTIDLKDVTSAGSCINCDITFDTKGRAISYASGTPPQFVNAPGAGDTLSILDTLKRLNAGFGITHTVTNYNITQKVDTSVIATQYDLTQISFTNSNIGPGYRWAVPNTNNIKTVFASNTILWDSTSNANALTAKADTSVLATQYDINQNYATFLLNKSITDYSKQVKINQTIGLFLGDSYMAGAGSSPFVGMDIIISRRLNITSQNHALASHGYATAVRQSFFNQDTIAGTKATFNFCGFNDVFRAAGSIRLNNNIRYTVRSLLANQFLATAIAANNAAITYGGGTWVTTFPADSAGLKCPTLAGGLPKSTFDVGATASWTTTSNSLVVGFAAGDGDTYKMDSFTVSIDGNSVGTFSFDSSAYNVPAGSVYPVSANKAGQACLVFQFLNNVSHTIIITKGTNASKRLVIDYFGTLAYPNNTAPIVIASIPHLTTFAKASALSTYGVTVTDAIVDTLNTIIADEIKGFSTYPATMFETNDYFINPIDFAADSIHPNYKGHMDISQGFLNKNLSDGSLSFYTSDGSLSSNRTVDLNSKILLLSNSINAISFGWARSGGDTYKAGISADGSGATQYFGIGINEINTRGATSTAYGGSVYFDSRGGQAPIGFFVHQSGTTSSTYAGQIGGNGNWRIGTGADANPSVGLYLNYTDAMRLPSGTTAQQPSGAAGYFRYNTTDNVIEWYNGTSWIRPAIGGGNTLYTGDGTVLGNRNINSNNLNITFSDVNTFRINHDIFAQSKADGTFPYSNVIVAPSQQLWAAYTPVPGVYSKGAAIIIDTNNNVSLGSGIMPTTAPLYTAGSAYIQGLQSSNGNFYRVTDITADQTLNLTHYWINVDATAGNITVTLPAASTAFGSTMGIQYVIRRTDATGNTVTISRAGSDTINGATTTTLAAQYNVKEIQCTSTSTWAIKSSF